MYGSGPASPSWRSTTPSILRIVWPCSTTWPAAVFSGGSAAAPSRPISRCSVWTTRIPLPCGPGRPKCWASDGQFTYHGKFFDIETPVFDPVKARGYYMKPYQQPHPPIAVAASTPNSGSMRMAGERGWIPMTSSLLSRPYLRDHWRLVEAGAASAGRPADRSQWRVARDVLVAPTSAAARERARAVLGRNYVEHQHPNRVGTIQMTSTKLEPSMPDEAVTVDYLMDNLWIVGDPSQCVEKIHQLYEESGGFGALLSITTDSDDAGWDEESLRLLMEQVAPRVAQIG